MYQGYRVKINGTIFPNDNMAKGSYSLGKNPRVAQEWEDLLGIHHEINFPSTKTEINFSIREHLPIDHSALTSFFSSRNVTVEYYDDNSDNYLTGSFKVGEIVWKHINVDGQGIFYAATPITLEEW